MNHITWLEDEIKKDIQWVHEKGGYKNMDNVSELREKLELWHLLRKFEERAGGAGTAEPAKEPRMFGQY